MRKHILIILAIVLVLAGAVIWWAVQPDVATLPIAKVEGERPTISAPRDQTIPTIAVADAVGWKDGARPVAAPGLKVVPFANGLDHPRWLYRLPNGDILVAETNSPPRKVAGIADVVMGYLMKKGAKPVDVLTGFLNAKGQAQGRPVGVITDATGALLVADDVGNTIWRVSAK